MIFIQKMSITMGNFRTKVNFSNQIKEYTNTEGTFSGSVYINQYTILGTDYSNLPLGLDNSTTGVTYFVSPIITDTFTGTTGSTTFYFSDSNMYLGTPYLSAITPSNTGITQNIFVTQPTYSTTVDGNNFDVYFSGVSYDLTATDIVEYSSGLYSGSLVTDFLLYISGTTYPWWFLKSGSTTWNEIKGRTKTDRLTITNSASTGYVLTSINNDGDSIWSDPSTIYGAIYIKNTVYVAKNGNDSTGLIERIDKPFLTINAALNAIRGTYPDSGRTPSNRVKVVVEDGTYNEGSYVFLYPYIDFDLGNSVINATFTDYTMSATYSANPNNDFTTKIFGNAKINQALGATFAITNENTRLLVQCDTVSSDADDCFSMSYGYCRVICNLIINNASTSTVGGFLLFCHAIEMTQQNNTYPCVLDVVNATITQASSSYDGSPIHFGTAGSFTNPLNQTLNLYNCRVINTNNSITYGVEANSAISVGATHTEPSGSKLNLYNTTLYSLSGHTIYVSSAQTYANIDVYYYGTNNGNNSPFIPTIDANHTLNQYIGSLITDVNVQPQVF